MDVTVSYLTLACAPWGEHAKHNIANRARAAADAGITSLGVDFSDIPEMLAHKKEILSLVQIPECEWINLGVEQAYWGAPDQVKNLQILAGEFGTTRVNCGVCDMTTQPWQAARSLVALAEDTAKLGMMVAVEPVAFGSLPLLGDILELLHLADMPPNAGALVDCWQVTWPDWALPAKLNSHWPVAEIQVCGETREEARGTARESSQERMSLREMQGIGISIGQWLQQFNQPDAPVSYEVPRSDWREMELADVAKLVADDIRGM